MQTEADAEAGDGGHAGADHVGEKRAFLKVKEVGKNVSSKPYIMKLKFIFKFVRFPLLLSVVSALAVLCASADPAKFCA